MKRLLSIALLLALLLSGGIMPQWQGAALASESVSPQIKAATATGVSIAASTRTVEVGQSVLLTASVLPADATQGVSWGNSDRSVLHSELGPGGKGYLVTGLVPGKATIKATAQVNSSLSATCEITVVSAQDEPSDGTWESLYSRFVAQKLVSDGYGFYQTSEADYLSKLSLADFNMDGTPELILKDEAGCNNEMYTVSNGSVVHYAHVEHINKLYLYRVKSSKKYQFISDCTIGDACIKQFREWSRLSSKMRFHINEESDGKRRKFYYVSKKKVSKSTYNKKLKAYKKKRKLIVQYPNYELSAGKMTAYQRAASEYKGFVNQGKVPKK